MKSENIMMNKKKGSKAMESTNVRDALYLIFCGEV